MKKGILLSIITFITVSICAQIAYEERIEIELKDGFSNEKIFEFGDKGIVLMASNDHNQGQFREWVYKLYDNNLRLEISESIKISKKLSLDETFKDDNNIYTLFKNRKGDFTILTLNVNDMTISEVSGKLPKKCYIKHMSVLGDNAFFISSIKNSPYLFAINWKNGQHKPIPVSIKGAKSKYISLEDFQLLENTNEIMLYVNVTIKKANSETYIIRLDSQGDVIDNHHLTKDIDESIINVSAINIGQDEYIFTGTYSSKARSFSQGIYLCKTEGHEISYINFYKFSEFENFLSYLPERTQERIEKKKRRKEAKGKELKLSYRIAPHEIIFREKGYILVGEAYYPTYRTETYTTTSTVNGATTVTTHTRQVFDGYRYTHAFVAKFGHDGKLKWDQTFELWPSYKPYRVKKFISIAEQDNKSIKMIFVSRNRIISQSIDNTGNIIDQMKTEPIEASFSGDKVKGSYSNIDYWYGSNFIAYGSQKIKNKENKDVARKRKVYFISKIRYE